MTIVSSETLNHTFDQYPGQQSYRTISFRTRIASGQTIVSVTWTTESPVALVVGSSGISGDEISASFDTTGCVEGQSYGVVGIATLANPTEVWPEYFYLQILPLPV